MRRSGFIAFWGLVIVSILSAGWAYEYLRKAKRPSTQAEQAIPASCFLYLRAPDLHELAIRLEAQSLVVDELRSVPQFSQALRCIHVLDSMGSADELIREELLDNAVHFGIFDPDAPKWVLAFNLSRLGSERRIGASLSQVLHARADDGFYQISAGGFSVHVAIASGVVMISDNRRNLEQVQEAGDRFADSRRYDSLSGLLNDSHILTMFVDHSAYLRSRSVTGGLRMSEFTGDGHSAGIWSVYPSEVRCNGFLIPDEKNRFRTLTGEEGMEIRELFTQVPATVVSFTCSTTSPPEVAITSDSAFWKRADRNAMYPAAREFYSLAGRQLLECDGPGSRVLSVVVSDTLKMTNLLEAISDTIVKSHDVKIYRLTNDTLLPKLFYPCSSSGSRFARLLGDRLLLSAEVEGLNTHAESVLNGRTLAGDAAFMNYATQHIPPRCCYLIYARPSSITKPDIFPDSPKSNGVSFRGLRHFVFALTGDRGRLRYRIQLQHQPPSNEPAKKVEDNKLWTLQLDSPLIRRPVLFKNHINGENEVLISDAANHLYLVNAKGAVLWKKRIGEPLVSDISRVDALKNGKFQLLFATRNHLHLLDRNGNELTGFPVQLPAEITNPLRVYDYDRNREYRMLIACADKKIYNYTLNGRAAEGFTPIVTHSPVRLPVEHVRTAGNDFLIAIDDEGNIYGHNRKGLLRLSFKNKAIAGCPTFYVDAGTAASNSHIYYVDEKSRLLNKISLSDKKEILRLPSGDNPAHISFGQVDDNKRADLIVSSSGKISVHDLTGNVLFEANVSGEHPETENVVVGSRHYLVTYTRNGKAVCTVLPSRRQVVVEADAPPLLAGLFGDGGCYIISGRGRELSCQRIE